MEGFGGFKELFLRKPRAFGAELEKRSARIYRVGAEARRGQGDLRAPRRGEQFRFSPLWSDPFPAGLPAFRRIKQSRSPGFAASPEYRRSFVFQSFSGIPLPSFLMPPAKIMMLSTKAQVGVIPTSGNRSPAVHPVRVTHCLCKTIERSGS